MRIYLYGAGIIAYGVREALRELWGAEAAAHIVTHLEGGQREFEGVPVLELKALPWQMPGSLIVVATPTEYQAEIAASLCRQTACPFLLLDNRLQFSLLGAFFRKRYGLRLLEDLPTAAADGGLPDIEIYMAHSSHDKILRETVQVPANVLPVQAGAVLDNVRLAGLHDDEGENISERNRDFSELTVTYWAWQNRQAEWQGICHYRRVLGLGETDYRALAVSGADAVLPLPYLCPGNASFQYRRYVSEADMEMLCSVLDDGERQILERELDRPYLYNHNILLARRETFADYAGQLFSVLRRVEEHEKERGDWPRNDRHMGYLAEILTSVYFTSRAEELKIVHAPELWLV